MATRTAIKTAQKRRKAGAPKASIPSGGTEPDAPEAPLAPDPSEQRRLPRKSVILSGVVAEPNDAWVSDCVIQDVSALGAKIRLSKPLSVGMEVVLLNASNQTAHIAKVAWCASDQAGLSFLQSHAMGFGLPPKLNFLWRLLLEAKLNEILRVVAKGSPIALALCTSGLTNDLLHRMAVASSSDPKLARLYAQAKQLIAARK